MTVCRIAAVALALSALSAVHAASGPGAPSNLRCEYLSNPLGIDVAQPRFAWVLNHTNRGEKQTAYQVLVARSLDLLGRDQGDQWDSARVSSDDSIQVVYRGRALQTGHTYYWKVRFWDSGNRISPYSTPARFEMGLLSRDEWKGRWITGNQLRKEFRLQARVARARLYVTALGYYEVHLNGTRVGDRVLDPAWTSYDKRVLYSTYDVAGALERGENAIGVMLGGGWATLNRGLTVGKQYYSQPGLLLQLNIELTDGTRVNVQSDGSWKAGQGPIVSDSIYDGETYDARLETPGWDRSAFDDSTWTPAQVVPGSTGILSAQMMPPIQMVDTIVPLQMTNPDRGVYVYDMGQNMSGWAQLRVSGARGTAVKLRFSELKNADGTINRDNLRQAKARDVCILRGEGKETCEPHFTYHGFRYVEVTGYPGTPSVDAIRGRIVHTAVQGSGSFTASKPILNEIQHMIWRTQLSNLFSVPTDCDQRDERQGWLADAQVSAEEAMLNFDMAAFYSNFIRDIRDTQEQDGSIADTVPQKFGSRPADPAWGTAYPLLCWYMWQQYGDRRILEENYDGLTKYVELLRRRAPDNVLRYSLYGDWIAILPTPGELVSDAYYYYDVTILKNIARVLGRTADEQDYARLADEIRDAFNRTFFDPHTVGYGHGTQTANSMALVLGLVPEKERGRLAHHLSKDVIYNHNTHLTTGIIGTKFLMPALRENGYGDLAYELAVQTTFPSWGYMVEQGATTVWEIWQGKSSPAMNSHDHPALGSLGAWLYRALGGINLGADGEGYRHIRIAPLMVEDLRWASVSTDTVRGTVSSSWTHSPAGTKLEVNIPVNADAEVLIPKDPQMTEVTVREGRRIIWQKGQYVAGAEGVTGVRNEEHTVAVSVGSGRYIFQLTGQ